MGFILAEALRDLRRTGRVGLSAILLLMLSLAALGGFWLVSLNLERAIDQWRERVRLVAYLTEEPAAALRRMLADLKTMYAGRKLYLVLDDLSGSALVSNRSRIRRRGPVALRPMPFRWLALFMWGSYIVVGGLTV